MMMLDLTENFDTDNGNVLYDGAFIEYPETIKEQLITLGNRLFVRSSKSNRLRGGLSLSGEALVTESKVVNVPGLPWEGTLIDKYASILTVLLRKRGLIPNSATVNYCLYNMYESSKDHIGYHSDSESNSLPIIASLTIGYPRKFLFLHKETNNTIELNLESGSLLIFSGDINSRYMHCLPPGGIEHGHDPCRINLTFRVVIPFVKITNIRVKNSINTCMEDGFVRKYFTSDFWIITPNEASNCLPKCIMYKNWGYIGVFTDDIGKMEKKISTLSIKTKSSVNTSSDWFILPNLISVDELKVRFSSMAPYMSWKYVYKYMVPRQMSINTFSGIYNDTPPYNIEHTNTILV